jgi:hypothetical protein
MAFCLHVPSPALALDCNNNGIEDDSDISGGTSLDCNTNSVPDDCEIATVFSDQRNITTAAPGARSVFATDLDGDGDTDVLSASADDDKIAWYENTDGLGTFGSQRVISTAADFARFVYAADLDGDGDADVLSASYNDDKIAWYENADGLGGFGTQQIISTAANGVRSVFCADLDGDGDVDVLSASEDDKIAWYENTDGQGLFGAQKVITTAADSPYSVYAADLDDDGDADVLSASLNDDKIAWYENIDGLGTFGPQQVITVAADSALSVFAEDLDGDGDFDVLSASSNDNKVAWYENIDGQVSFGAQRVISTLAAGANSIFAADLDDDGDADVLSASSDFDEEVAWYENTDGQGNFGPQQIISTIFEQVNSVFAADLDGDGNIDVLSASDDDNKIAWYKNSTLNDCNKSGIHDDCELVNNDCNSNGVPDDCEPDCNLNGVADGCDINGPTSDDCNTNGLPDDCEPDCNENGVADSCDIASGISNDCNQNSVPDQCELTTGAATDCNSNGSLDICDLASQLSYDCNTNGLPDECDSDCNANGIHDECDTATQFLAEVITTAAYGSWSVFAADLDSDGDADVLSASYSDDKIAWYENTDGLGTFGPQQIITITADHTQSVFADDLNGDGDIDVLSASSFDDKIAWYENLGSGVFGPQQVISLAANGAISVLAADLDDDGDADILSASNVDHKVAWYENTDGQGNFGPQKIITTAALGAWSAIADDIDSDGDLDVLSASFIDNKVAWYENIDGLGNFGPPQVISTTADFVTSVFAGDLDGDGDADVISGSIHNYKIAWYENIDGLGNFGPQQVVTVAGNGTSSVFLADLNGDGAPDILSTSGFDDIAWHENVDGLGGFGPRRVITTNAIGPRSVFALDLDGDGDFDVLSASEFDNKIAWYENTGNDCNGNRIPDACESDIDGDGLIDDCDFCAGGAASGDSNANGITDLVDFGNFEPCLTGPNGGLRTGCECFDFDNDGDNDLQDFAVFQASLSDNP